MVLKNAIINLIYKTVSSKKWLFRRILSQPDPSEKQASKGNFHILGTKGKNHFKMKLSKTA
jgi:hypothetical protein